MSLRKRMSLTLVAGAVVAGALAGASDAAAPGGKAVAFYPGGARAAAKSAPRLETYRTGQRQIGEPNIGIAKDGTIWASAMTNVVRSTDRGKSWKLLPITGHAATLDPYLYVDPATSRVYKSDLAGTCQVLSWSDDKGATWTHAPAACNQSDHQSIAAGPPVAGLPVTGYENVLYNCSQTLGYNGYSFATGCARSLDGGLSWTPTGTFAFADPSPYGVGEGSGDAGIPGHCNGDNGPIFVAPYGRLFVPRGWCNQPWLAWSDDGGTTWTRVEVAKNGMNTSTSGGFGFVAPGSGQSDHEAAVVADKAGNVYYMWVAKDRLPYLAISRDKGKTFGPPLKVAPPGLKEAWGPALDVDSKGRVAMAYMGSTNSPGKPWTGSYADTTFTGYLGVISKPLDKKPLIWAGPVTPAKTPFAYGKCGPGRCNEGVLDFIDVAFAPDGSVWGAFIDTSLSDELIMGKLGTVR
ncbi:MAG TPA: sialidase family protein [Frankiaceae bacterium]|nr:sialidase family protein [Frankiaceae bacterium]